MAPKSQHYSLHFFALYIDVLSVCGLRGSDLFTLLEFLTATRDTAVLRYKEKKKSRRFDEKTRYASCKERTDYRKHVKGRFVKTGDPYDYDTSHLATSQ